MDILSDTSGGPNVLKVARSRARRRRCSGKEVTPVTFDVDSIRKDLRTMIEEGHALGSALPVTERALAVLRRSFERRAGAEGRLDAAGAICEEIATSESENLLSAGKPYVRK